MSSGEPGRRGCGSVGVLPDTEHRRQTLARNRKALQRLVVVAAVEVAAAVELANVASSVIGPHDCACDHARIAPVPADFPGPEGRPETSPVAFDRTPSAASISTQVSAISTVGWESLGHVSGTSSLSS